jgi:DNA-binding MarR family transcriptional regulator
MASQVCSNGGRPDDEQLEGRISLLVHRLNSRFTQIANQLLQTRDLNMYDARILLFVLERDEMRVGELVEAMALPQSTISHQLSRLKARKLIRRRRTRGDNRAVVITLTPLGEEAARASESFSRFVQRRIAEQLNPGDIRIFRELLVRTYKVLSESEIVPDESLKPAKPARTRCAHRVIATSRSD